MTREIGVGKLENQTTFMLSIVLRCSRAEDTATSIAEKYLATQDSFVKKKLVRKVTLDNFSQQIGREFHLTENLNKLKKPSDKRSLIKFPEFTVNLTSIEKSPLLNGRDVLTQRPMPTLFKQLTKTQIQATNESCVGRIFPHGCDSFSKRSARPQTVINFMIPVYNAACRTNKKNCPLWTE